MRVAPSRVLSIIGVVTVAAAALAQCLGPTEIELVVTTDLPCASVHRTAIAVGPPGDDSRAASAVTASCSDDGRIGTLIITPSGGLDDEVAIRATLGANVDVEKCVAPDFKGCIVARRQIRYGAHTKLRLPVSLDQACIDKPCDANTTCVGGQCVDAGISTCNDDLCSIGDAGAPDAPPIDGSPDAGCVDVGPTLVAALGNFKPQPHVMRTNNGWAVAFETAAVSAPRELHAVTIDRAGNVSQPQVLAAMTSGGLAFSAVGSNGSEYGFATMRPSASFVGSIVPIGSGNPLGSATIGGVQDLSSFGFVWDSPSSEFYFLGLASAGNVVVGALGADATSFSKTPLDITVTTAQAPALSASGGHFFATAFDGTGNCLFDECTSLLPVSCIQQMLTGCTVARAARQAAVVLVAERDAKGVGRVFDVSATTVSIVLGAIDANGAVVLPSGTANFDVLWSANGMLQLETVTSLVQAGVPVTLATDANAPTLFDAIAEPPTTAYDVAYYDGVKGGVYFMHRCQ